MTFHSPSARREPTAGSWALLALLGLIWGSSFLGVEMSLIDFKPITNAAIRVSLAAILLLAIALWTGHRLPGFATSTKKRIWLHCFGMGLFTNALPFSLLAWGQQQVTSSFAGVSMAVVPLLVLPLSHFLVPGERMTRAKVAGFAVGFVGVFLLVGGDSLLGGGGTTPRLFLAQIACVGASCCYAIGSIVTRLCPPIPTQSFATTGLLLGSVMLIPTALFFEGLPQTASLPALAGVLYLALFPTAAATILLTVLIKRAGPPFLSLVNYQVPVWAVIIGAVVLLEPLPGHFLMALLVILAGLALSQFYDRWRNS
jgi:drug/metabolite transporter (DMT)-like permease